MALTDPQITEIIQEAAGLAIESQPFYIARRAVRAARDADAAISPEALADEYRASYQQEYGRPPGAPAVAEAVRWARHLLSRGAA